MHKRVRISRLYIKRRSSYAKQAIWSSVAFCFKGVQKPPAKGFIMNTLVLLCAVVAGASASTFYTGIYGHSGIVNYDGNNVQFTPEEAANIILVGPSGVVTRDGNNLQRLPDHSRSKRNVGYVNNKGSIGYSGVVRTDGTIQAFTPEDIDNIVLFGPSGVVTKDGQNWQLDENLNIRRTKRHLVGDSGIITRDGTPVQFKRAGVKILLEGPSGFLLTDGTQVQFRSKRDTQYGHYFGTSGVVTKDGKQFQFPHGATVVSAGPSGVVFSNGQNIQF
ncbi:uncharacterized protein LOC135204124 [Macrobrachium nipponense]|uniref:uncharacterized protein LOC135204124 n=1 Tax=Macrobrachium nipponense TaxID=159736 RepID=UPI0030C8602A